MADARGDIQAAKEMNVFARRLRRRPKPELKNCYKPAPGKRRLADVAALLLR